TFVYVSHFLFPLRPYSNNLTLDCQSDIVFSDPGDDVVLSCHLEPAISAASMEIKWWKRADLVCHYKDGQMTVSRDYEGRVSLPLHDLHNGNVSLTLRDVRRSQKGLYICEVIYECKTIKENIFLHIRCKYSLCFISYTIIYSYSCIVVFYSNMAAMKCENTWKDKHLPDPLRQLLSDETPFHKTLDHGKFAKKRKHNGKSKCSKKSLSDYYEIAIGIAWGKKPHSDVHRCL
uniref:Ig-like domain-containing protein n=1 Tax=Cyprinus carpio TaxID=7962 RepID=A0A8C1QEJ3_CYPCA